MTEVDVTNRRIFCKRSYHDVFCKKGALKYLAKLTGKYVYRGLFQKTFQAVDLQLYLKRGSCKGFFSVTFLKLFRTAFLYSTVHTWIAASDLIENLETLTISEDLRKSLKILTNIVDFTGNIWHFSVAMKQSENRI